MAADGPHSFFASCASLMAFMVVMTPALLVAGMLSMPVMARGSDSRRWKFGAAQSSSPGAPKTSTNKQWIACRRRAVGPGLSASRVPSSPLS